MIPDGNLDLHERMKKTRDDKCVSKCCFLKKYNWLFKTREVAMYCEVYNICRSKTYNNNNRKDGKKENRNTME